MRPTQRPSFGAMRGTRARWAGAPVPGAGVQPATGLATLGPVRWIVGDVQACVRELETLLREIDYDPARDELWCAGDLINRGPDSAATVRLFRDAGLRGVIGNHEVYALCAQSGRWPRKPDQLEAFFEAPDIEVLLQTLRGLPLLVHLPGEGGPDAWLVHGGVHPKWDDLHAVAERIESGPHDDDWLESAEVAFATRIRCCNAKGKRVRWHGEPAGVPDGFVPWYELYRGETLVVHGHWASHGYHRGTNVMGLDTACVYGGTLTAWCQQEDRLVSVPAARAYI